MMIDNDSLQKEERLKQAESISHSNMRGQGKPFLSNHGAIVPSFMGNNTPSNVQLWNTGVADIHNTKKMTDRANIEDAISDLNMQKAVNIERKAKQALIQQQKQKEMDKNLGYDDDTKRYLNNVQRMIRSQ